MICDNHKQSHLETNNRSFSQKPVFKNKHDYSIKQAIYRKKPTRAEYRRNSQFGQWKSEEEFPMLNPTAPFLPAHLDRNVTNKRVHTFEEVLVSPCPREDRIRAAVHRDEERPPQFACLERSDVECCSLDKALWVRDGLDETTPQRRGLIGHLQTEKNEIFCWNLVFCLKIDWKDK